MRCFGGCGGKGSQGDSRNNIPIAKSLFEERLKDGCLHTLTIGEGSHGAIQLKKIQDTLPIIYVEKGYKYLVNVNCNNQELVEATHMPAYQDVLNLRWSRQIFVGIDTIDPNWEVYKFPVLIEAYKDLANL